MKKLFILIVCLFAAKSLFAWGQKGHDVTAYIAECHLTPEAAEKVGKVLNGHSLVYYASWLDIASHQPAYNYTRTWHYMNIEKDETPHTAFKEPKGNILTAVTSIVEKLKKGGLSTEEEFLSLKMLIHLVGDIHCPMHTGRRSDLGGNKVQVKFFGIPTNLHSVWDGAVPDATHRWSYTEWQQQVDRSSKETIEQIQQGEPADWIGETHRICVDLYAETPPGAEISYDYIDRNTPIVEMQFLRGGYRLAKLINEIYK